MNKRIIDTVAVAICLAWAVVVLPRMVTGPWSATGESIINWGGGCLRLGLLAVAAFASVRGLRALGSDNPARGSQLFLAGGFVTFFLAQAALFGLTAASGGKTPYPSIADLGFIVAMVLLITSVALAIREWLRLDVFPDGGKKAATAAAVTAVPLALGVGWTIHYLTAAPVSQLQTLVDITYPVLNSVFLVGAAAMLRLTALLGRGLVGVVWRSLLAGFVATAIADVMYSFFAGYDLAALDPALDLLYMVAYSLFARGTLLQASLLRD